MPRPFTRWTLPRATPSKDLDGTPPNGDSERITGRWDQELAERRRFFLEGMDFPAAWRDRSRVTVCEIGFGTGLTLLLTWDALRHLPHPRPTLRYLAIEGAPLEAKDLAPVHAAAGIPPELTARLLNRLPPRQPGLHLVPLGDGIDLILAQGPMDVMLAGLSDPSIDLWYLNAVTSDCTTKTPWPKALPRIATLSAPGARLAIAPGVGDIQPPLIALGFSKDPRPGHGWHYDLAQGQAAPPSSPHRDTRTPPRKTRPPPDSQSQGLWKGRPLPQGARVALVGAGIAGCAAARALTRAGLSPLLLDAREAIAEEASGNPVGLFMPRLAVDPSADGRFHAAAWVHALGVYQDMAARGQDPWVGPKGLLSLSANAREAVRQRKVGEGYEWPGDWLTRPTAEDQVRWTGQPGFHDEAALWMGAARCLRPGAICAALAGNTPRRLGFSVVEMTPRAEGWLLKAADGREESADAVVLCAGAQVGPLQPSGTPAPRITRGQISLFVAPDSLPTHPLSFGGYLSPALTGPDGAPLQILGASHDPMVTAEDPGWDRPDPASHAHCLDMLEQRLPGLAARLANKPWRARISRRARTADHTPLVGPLPASKERAVEVLDALRHGPRRALSDDRIPEAYGPNLWILGGLGTRGFQTAPLAAEVLAASLTAAAFPVEEDVRQALHPARFLVRAMARGEV